MNNQIEKLQNAQKYAMANRPSIGGFPFLAECMRRAGVNQNVWSLPSAQSIYVMDEGSVVQQGTPLISGMENIAPFDKDALIKAIRTDQKGESTFPDFLMNSWKAGVVRYVADFSKRTVTYYGVNDESYVEEYPAVEIGDIDFEN